MRGVMRFEEPAAVRVCRYAVCLTVCLVMTACATPGASNLQAQSGSGAGPQSLEAATCAILNVGNQQYVKGDFAAAIEAYRLVETVDRHGNTGCTASIYASIATSYSILAEGRLAASPKEAADFYRIASRYNRAFAYAVECELRDCKNSIDFWKQGY